jgi:hypothetical protein
MAQVQVRVVQTLRPSISLTLSSHVHSVFSNSGVNRAQFSSDTTVSAPQKSLQLSTTSYVIRKCHGHEAEVSHRPLLQRYYSPDNP